MSYIDALFGLLPRGLLWGKKEGSELEAFLQGHADELLRVDGSAQDLMSEANPTTAIGALEDWERVAGLPYCDLSSDTVTERRAHLLARLYRPCGQNAAYFESLAKTLGYDDPVVEGFAPFQADVSCADDAVNDAAGGGVVDWSTSPPTVTVGLHDGWRNVWRLTVSGQPTYDFLADEGAAETPLSWWGDSQLECVIRAASPAHALVIFAYTE